MNNALERLQAAEEIRKLVQIYPWAADVGDFKTVAAAQDGMKVTVFGVDGQQLGTTAERSAEEVEKLYSEYVIVDSDGLPNTKHLITNVVIDVEEDAQQATGRSYFTVLQAKVDFPLQIVISGRYVDRYERRAGSWRIAERVEYLDLIGDISQHMRTSLEEAANA